MYTVLKDSSAVPPPLDLDEVVAIEPEPSGQCFADDVADVLGAVRMPTGRYRDQPLSAIPRDYLAWAVTRGWCHGTPLGLTLRAYLAATEGQS
jgi:uncharacterized protein (DUF3820 family)